MRKFALALVVLAAPAWSQEPDLDLRISQAELEDLVYKAKIGGPIVAIMDGCREEVRGEEHTLHANILGKKVSETLRLLLRPTRFPIRQIDYSALKERLRAESVSASEMCDRQVAGWAARLVDGLIVILPRLRRDNNHLVIRVEAIRITTNEVVGSLSRRVPLDGEVLSLFLAQMEGPREQAGPHQAPIAPRNVVKAGESGVGEPRCMYCPNPTYTDAAVTARFHGSLSLRVVVSEEGRVAHIEVVEGLPFGLTTKAIQTVITWRFDPARNSEWKPVAVWIMVEITFRQY